ncbi:MAG: HD domain-containing protein [Oscillospiraceae bacterium]|nr:HD domain-containing protein [Oscillospiraceae bacterium]
MLGGLTLALSYHKLEKEIENRIISDRRENKQNPYKASDDDAVRRNPDRDKSTLLRPAYARDIDKILHLPLYNRYNDKTQVFSLYNNDDITRRGLHVQLVSRIARNIGRLLDLNLDLIEAIALGHDIGHTPFGHAGERYLSELLQSETGLFFNHNVHSARVLDVLYKRNISLQVLDGILCHNGEFELSEYRPCNLSGFEEYEQRISDCYTLGKPAIDKLIPMTLEGCVVRISDIIAYIGKDRQDAVTTKVITEDFDFTSEYIGKRNAEMINNLVVDIVNNSYGKDYIQLSQSAFDDLRTAKEENYKHIYLSDGLNEMYESSIKPMIKEVYYKLLGDVVSKNEDSIIYKHHISYIEKSLQYYSDFDYLREEPNQIVVDYIASMTDDYFIELHRLLFPDSKYKIEYKSYFEK